MLECSKAGWAEVIRGFGRNAQGRYGAWNVMLPEVSSPPVLTNELCWENWALNGTIRAAWVDDVIVTSAEDLSRSVVELAGDVNVFAGLVTATTLEVVRARLRRPPSNPGNQAGWRGGDGTGLSVDKPRWRRI
jgi:hypothetical protein